MFSKDEGGGVARDLFFLQNFMFLKVFTFKSKFLFFSLLFIFLTLTEQNQ